MQEQAESLPQAVLSAAGIEKLLPGLPVRCVLDDKAWLVAKIGGADATSFLQRMLCCDMKLLGPEQALPGALCSIDGKVQCLLLIFQHQQQMFMLAPRESGNAMLAGIRKFILRDDVQMEESTELEISGDTEVGQLPESAWSCLYAEGQDVTSIRMPGPYPRCLRARKRGDGGEGAASTQQAWLLLDVFSGIPWQFAADCGHYLPQALGLDRLGAVHFDKGCYPGQEIITRLQHRGKQVKRGIYHCIAQQQLSPGAAISAANQQAAGEALYGAMAANGQFHGLVVVNHDKIESELRCGQEPLKLHRLHGAAP